MPSVNIGFDKEVERELEKRAKKYGLTPEEFVRNNTLRAVENGFDLVIYEKARSMCTPEGAATLTFEEAMESAVICSDGSFHILESVLNDNPDSDLQAVGE